MTFERTGARPGREELERTNASVTPRKVRSRETDLERFEAKFARTEGCWEWTAGKHWDGYGQFWLDGANVLAHKASYLFFKGPIPSAMHVLHRCDNPACVNPDHLFPGTHQDNMNDMTRKGRQRPRGKRSGNGHGVRLEPA